METLKRMFCSPSMKEALRRAINNQKTLTTQDAWEFHHHHDIPMRHQPHSSPPQSVRLFFIAVALFSFMSAISFYGTEEIIS